MDKAPNGLIYGYSFYLDLMTASWDALIMNDYEAVMPLPWKKKLGIAYLYHPFLTAQLGVFGSNLSAGMVERFLGSIPKKFRYWDFSLNHANLFSVRGFQLYERSNYVLDLNRPYEELHRNYRDNIRRNAKKALEYGCYPDKAIDVDAVIGLAREHAKEVDSSDFSRFKVLYHQLHQKGMAKAYGMFSKQGELIASAAFFFSHRRAYYILVGNHPNGRTMGASHALIDGFIRDHAGKYLLLDFEGSDIRNLAFFYSSFGAREEKYAAIRLNRLPFWARWMKR
jgi:hypothetical protein